jgi:GNAT superfamily N-acetyltransferase
LPPFSPTASTEAPRSATSRPSRTSRPAPRSRASLSRSRRAAAFLEGELVGTVQVVLGTPANQQHRGEIARLLVRRSARRRGIAQRLMERAEREAAAEGRTLLVLDTVTGDDGERLYERLGWTRVGVIPGYALYPDGRPCDTTVFWKAT